MRDQCGNFSFTNGDVIDWCGEQYVVLNNYGNSGAVQEYLLDGSLGTIISNFYWEYGNETAVLVKNIGVIHYNL